MKRILVPTVKWILGVLMAVHSVTALSAADKNTHEGYQHGPPEAWVSRHSPQNDLGDPPTQPQRYLLIDKQFFVLDEQNKRYFHQVSSPLTSSGVTEASELKIVYNAEFETLTLHSVSVLRDGKKRDLMSTLDPKFLQQEPEIDSLIHTGLVTVVFSLPDIRIGDIIEYDYTLSGRNPILGKKAFGMTSLNWNVVVDDLRVRVVGDKNLNIQLKNSTNALRKRALDKGVAYSYLQSPTQAIKDEDHYPPDVSPYAYLEYSAYDSWEQINQWAEDVYARIPASQKLKQLSQTLEAKSHNTDDYIQNVIQFVQEDIRYLGLEIGENTHLPRSPEDILTTRFGDCKDKALIISQLLKLKGVKAYPALVNTIQRNGIDERFPSPGAFDHVINVIDYQGKRYWIDGTAQYQGSGLPHIGKSDYGYALVIGGSESGLVKMYPSKPVVSEVHIDEKFILKDFSGDAEYKVKTRYYGKAAEFQRYRFANYAANKITQEYTDYYGKLFKNINSLATIKSSDDKDNNVFITYEHYKVKDLLEEKEGYYVTPVVLTIYASYLPKPDIRHRKHAQYLGNLVKVSSDFSIQYPQEVDLRLPSEAKTIKSNEYIYEYKDKYRDKVYTHSTSLTFLDDRIMPKNISSYLDQREKLTQEWDFTITVPKPDLFAGYDKIVELKNRLRVLKETHDEI